MSQVTRYTTKLLQSDKTGRLEICPCYEGEWIAYSDYAALVQQGIRDHQDWRSKLNFLEADYKAEVARLTAENERLRKVGFNLAMRLSWCGNLGDEPLIEEWQQLTGTDVYKDEEGGAK